MLAEMPESNQDSVNLFAFYIYWFEILYAALNEVLNIIKGFSIPIWIVGSQRPRNS